MALRVVVLSALVACSVHGFSLAPSVRMPHSSAHRSSAVSPQVRPLRIENRLRTVGVSLNMVAAMDTDTETDEETPKGPPIKYLTVAEAKQIDEELMDEDTGGFSQVTMMELNGQSVAESIYDMYRPELLDGYTVLVICGPGQNGGDALVTARHLRLMGYAVEVVYPNRNNQQPFRDLVNQLKALDVRVNMGMPGTASRCALVVDGIFGTGFEGDINAPYDFILKQMRDPSMFGAVPIVSIDVPSGWDVEFGPPEDTAMRIEPDLLVSLTAPKKFARTYNGMHYLGGRFVPSRMSFKYKLNLPAFPGKEQWVSLPQPPPLTAEEKAEEAALREARGQAPAEEEGEEIVSDIPQELEGGNPLASFESAAFGGGAAAKASTGSVNTWPDPDPQMSAKISEASERALRVLGEKRDGWDQQIRQLVAAQLAPLGWTSTYPPDKTTIAKVCFLAAKTLKDRGFDNMDVLAEGRSIAEGVFESDGDMAAGKVLRGIAALYGVNGEEDMERMVLEEVERVRVARGFPEDLDPIPVRPGYTFADKWTVNIAGPADMEEGFEVVVRPNQKISLLMKAWFGQNDVEPADEEQYEFYVPDMPKTWKSGVVLDKEAEIGATGVLDGNTLMVRRKEAAAEVETETAAEEA
mmetsp:Transcript_33420/g.79681  ORF Transcript_33420/g.79681 Transcript_33420/m.79681 type:complete len:637 (-) Transcript_33420:438-2348(-)